MQTTTNELPAAARRILRRFEPAFRAKLEICIKQQLEDEDHLTLELISRCISKVFSELDRNQDQGPDPRIAELSRRAYKQGRFKTSREYLDDLYSHMAGTYSESDSGI